mgnify:CR=1 FL=1
MTLTIYQRRLPHWRLKGSTYFVTWRIHPKQKILTPEERTLVQSTILHFDKKRYELFAYVVMDDHVHVLFSPLEDFRVEEIVHSWKSYSVNKLQQNQFRKGRVWLDEYFDRIIRNESDLIEKANYILNNPQKRWSGIENYSWVWTMGQ